MVCNAKENTPVYARAFYILKEELARAGLGEPRQINLDWGAAGRRAAREVFPSAVIVSDLEHMRRNLRKNQTAGKRVQRRLDAVAKAKAAGRSVVLERIFHSFLGYVWTIN